MISLVFVFLINIFTLSSQDSGTSPEKVQPALAAENKNRFIVFSGSDWCKGCIQFRKKVLSDPSFESFARENLEIVVADFPQRTKLSKDIVAQNEALAEKYNPKGVFPNLVLISADGNHFEIVKYNNQTPQEFVSELKTRLQHLNG
ncbi:thioredoxin family protein [Dyadobacter sp. LHD-138]|uniref:thioredoxin family protein n=1 Tax=Dyadobacter sp. LHD-138 TaxID=3071413 RepID=UPI0027DFA439|nr:thioredoxin family protein [Dyadobacter sp. LHD-138]MDQ6478672.1 thioredoxin family protein [Dyadobacter sp. LHD-138]